MLSSRSLVGAALAGDVRRRLLCSFTSAAATADADLHRAIHHFLSSHPRPSAAAAASFATAIDLRCHPTAVSSFLSKPSAASLSVANLRALLALCAAASLPCAALDALRLAPTVGIVPDTASFNTVLRILIASSQTLAFDIRALLDVMITSGATPDVTTLASAVQAVATTGDAASARYLVDRMPTFGCTPGVVVYTALLSGMCAHGDLHAAMNLLTEMENDLGETCRPNVVSYTCLINFLCQKGFLDAAMTMFDRMVSHGVSANTVLLHALTSNLLDKGRVAEANDVFNRMIGMGTVLWSEGYNTFLVVLLRAGYLEQAEGLLQSMFEKYIWPRTSLCNSLLRELCSRRRFSDVHHWLDELQDKGLRVDNDVYARLLDGLCNEGDVSQAVVFAKKIAEKGIRIRGSCVEIKCAIERLRSHGEEALVSQIML